MRGTLGVTLKIGVWFVVFLTAQSNRCSDEEIDSCYDEAFSPFSSLVEHSVIVPSVTEQEMRQHCREYENAKTCIKGLERHCNTTDIAVFRGRDKAYQWLCEEAFDEYLDHRECFAKPTLHEGGRECNESLARDLDNLNTTNRIRYFTKICLYANHYLDCIENTVRLECNAAAGTWQREMDLRLLGPLLSLAACRLDGHGRVYYQAPEPAASSSDDGISSTTYIIIGCIIALSVVIAVILVMTLLLIRKRQKQRSNAPYDSSGGPYVVYNNGANSTAQIYTTPTGGAEAGPLPGKVPEPPPYDPLPPPSYSQGPAVHSKGTRAPSVAGSTRTQPPEYRSQAGSEIGSTRSGSKHRNTGNYYSTPYSTAIPGASSGYLEPTNEPMSDTRSTKSHRSRASDRRY